jgi:hypothetical protein
MPFVISPTLARIILFSPAIVCSSHNKWQKHISWKVRTIRNWLRKTAKLITVGKKPLGSQEKNDTVI